MVDDDRAAELPPGEVIPARWLTRHIEDTTARGIVAAMTDLIRHRDDVKDRYLPTVRNLARTLQVSPATVAKAWRVLGEAGLISTNGSQGTRILEEEAPGHRLQTVMGGLPTPLDLMSPSPDPVLLPDIGPHLAAVMTSDALGDFNRYGGDTLIGPLKDYARRTWPFEPAAILPCSGCYDGVLLLLDVLARPGTRVAVESPTAAPILDQLEYLRCEIVPIRSDGEGMVPSALAAAGGVQVVVVQTRFSSPDGHTMTKERAGELAQVLQSSRVVPTVIESDPAPLLAADPDVSLGRWLPHRVVLVRGWNKSHGPDLRIGLIGGAAGIVQLARRRRAMGSVWTSRLLQATLSLMLDDADVAATIDRAAAEYRRRRTALAEELRQREIPTTGTQGFSLWVPVPDEHVALRVLRARGISASAGSSFTQLPVSQHHLRICTTRLPIERAAEVACVVEEAAQATRPARTN